MAEASSRRKEFEANMSEFAQDKAELIELGNRCTTPEQFATLKTGFATIRQARRAVITFYRSAP